MHTTCKALLAGIFGLVTLVAGVIIIVVNLTNGMVEAANNFFDAAKQQQTAKARGYLSEAFQANTNQQNLRHYLSDNSLLNYETANWNSRSIENNRGKLEGTISTTTGGNIPIRIRFVKEQGLWKIYSIQTLKPGLQPNEPGERKPNGGAASQSGILL